MTFIPIENQTELSNIENPPKNIVKLILDATCAPGDISYPTDLGLLNQARKQTEKIIDLLYEQISFKLDKKPRTYRNIARKDYLQVAKKRRVAGSKIRKILRIHCRLLPAIL